MSDPHNTFDSGPANRHPGTISSSLLGGIKESQADAWARMGLLYGPLVYFWCRKTGLQAADAEDVAQEVLRTVVSRIGDFQRSQAEGSFRGWLRTITRHKLGDYIRADRRRQHVSGDLSAVAAFPETHATGKILSDAASEEEKRLVFDRVLELIQATFEERTWRAFLRVVMDGAQPRDVAEELELSVESVYQAKSRVLRRIRDELRELGE